MKTIDAEHYLLEATLSTDKVESFDEYPFNLPVVQNLTNLTFHPDVTFLVGENGTGKSTLLEALAVGMGFNPEGGSRNFSFSTRESHSSLSEHLTLSKGIKKPKDGYFLRAESFFNVATEIEKLDEEPADAPPIISSYGDKSLHEQSHGESFMSLLQHRMGGNGLYFLDEPEAALSPSRQFSMLTRVNQLCQADSQFIIATHSPIIMAYPEAYIYLISENEIKEVQYKDTEHYQLTKYFLDNPDKVLKEVINDK